MRKIIHILPLLLLSLSSLANSAQPGLWNAGGTGSFSLLFPEDSTGFKKVQMAREKVCIQLYRGYAVVKGTYWMYNTSTDTVKIKSGYPINSYFEGGNMNMAGVHFDDLYQLKVEINDQEANVWKDDQEGILNGNEVNNWYVWNSTFPPNDTTKFEVYFIVNTSYAKVRKGYSKQDVNGFIYLLETGANWKQPILKGQILIELMEGLTSKDIRGIVPNNTYNYNGTSHIIKYEFEHLSPTWENNIVINYDGTVNYNYATLLNKSEELYATIDALDASDLSRGTFSEMRFEDPFEVHGYANNPLAVIFYVIIGVLCVLGIGLILLIVMIVRKKKKRKE